MKNLKVDSRGFPIPHIVMVKDGVAHFKINDDRIVENCIANNLCSICGNKLYNDMWMIGGPLSAFHPQGVYIDIPIHYDCGKYALQVCPYLAISTYNSKMEMGIFRSDNLKDILLHNPTKTKDRVPYFVFSKISRYTVRRNGINRYIVPQKPYLEIQYWNDGEEMKNVDVIKQILRNHIINIDD